MKEEDYLKWCIDRIRPLTLDFQIKLWSKRGYIEEGYTSYDKMPSFKVWLVIQSSCESLQVQTPHL